MTPQEQEMIESVFRRLASQGVGVKDTAAEILINTRAAQSPDVAYGLVQAVVALEAGLNHANAKISELQNQISKLSALGGNAAPSSFAAGGGPWGSNAAMRPATTAPAMPPPAAIQSPWGNQPAMMAASPLPQSGGFLQNAATMAIGVAGGALIAEGISSMLGGGHHGMGYGGVGGGDHIENVTINNYGNSSADAEDDSDQGDDGIDDGVGADWGGGSDGGDFDT